MMSGRIRDYATLFLRIALAAAFLTSVTDRLGMWGSYGTTNVAWGDMTHFTAYTAKLNPWFPNGFIPVVVWFVTAAETILAVTLLCGFHTRIAAQFTGWLLLAFAVGMTAGTGIKSALNASVFSAAAGAFLLAAANAYPFSVDALRRKHRDPAREACIKSQLKNTYCSARFRPESARSVTRPVNDGSIRISHSNGELHGVPAGQL